MVRLRYVLERPGRITTGRRDRLTSWRLHVVCVLRIVMRFPRRRLRCRGPKGGIHRSLELSDRVTLFLGHVGLRIDIPTAEVDVLGWIRDLLTGAPLVDECANVPFDITSFQRKSDLLARLSLALVSYNPAENPLTNTYAVVAHAHGRRDIS